MSDSYFKENWGSTSGGARCTPSVDWGRCCVRRPYSPFEADGTRTTQSYEVAEGEGKLAVDTVFFCLGNCLGRGSMRAQAKRESQTSPIGWRTRGLAFNAA